MTAPSSGDLPVLPNILTSFSTDTFFSRALWHHAVHLYGRCNGMCCSHPGWCKSNSNWLFFLVFQSSHQFLSKICLGQWPPSCVEQEKNLAWPEHWTGNSIAEDSDCHWMAAQYTCLQSQAISTLRCSVLESRAGELRSANTNIRSVHIITDRKIDFRLQNFVHNHDQIRGKCWDRATGNSSTSLSAVHNSSVSHRFFLLPGLVLLPKGHCNINKNHQEIKATAKDERVEENR